MAYPFLPVNPCCTDIVINDPCGCSSVVTNSGCNNNNPCSTILTASSTIVYDGPALSCIIAEPCDTLNVILQKIDSIICNLLTQINTLTVQVNNITTQIITINGDIININNQLDQCCGATTSTTSTSSSTSTTSTTLPPCENFSLNNTGVDPVAVIITDCTTQEQSAIVLLPGDTNICVITDSPLVVPGTIIVTPNGPCAPPTTTTTSSSSTSSTSSTTTTTTTAIPCECLTFENTDDSDHLISYKDCLNINVINVPIISKEIIQVCGSQGYADDNYVTISIGANCIEAVCPTSSTTTTSTTLCQDCIAYGFTNPNDGNGSKTLPNGLTITTTYVGPSIAVTAPRGDSTNCAGFTLDSDCLFLGQINGAFTLIINFSYPVNDIYINTISMGYNQNPGESECYTVESDEGTPTVVEVGGCYDFGVIGNVVCGSFQEGNTGGTVRVSTPIPYSQLTITGIGIGNLAGYGLDICFPTCLTTTTTSTTAVPSCTQYTWYLDGIDPKTEITLEYTDCNQTPVSITQAAELFGSVYLFCAIYNTVDISPALGTTVTSGDCVIPCFVTIGDQVWECKNLDVTEYANGDPIPEVTDGLAWAALTTGAWCSYDNDPANDAIYGKLYNWYAVTDPRGLAPAGYHIPTNNEWATTVAFLGGSAIAGGPLKETGTSHWNSPNTNATNITNFTAVPGGFRNYFGGFDQKGNESMFWTPDEIAGQAYTRIIFYNSGGLFNTNIQKMYGASVRLLQD